MTWYLFYVLIYIIEKGVVCEQKAYLHFFLVFLASFSFLKHHIISNIIKVSTFISLRIHLVSFFILEYVRINSTLARSLVPSKFGKVRKFCHYLPMSILELWCLSRTNVWKLNIAIYKKTVNILQWQSPIEHNFMSCYHGYEKMTIQNDLSK